MHTTVTKSQFICWNCLFCVTKSPNFKRFSLISYKLMCFFSLIVWNSGNCSSMLIAKGFVSPLIQNKQKYWFNCYIRWKNSKHSHFKSWNQWIFFFFKKLWLIDYLNRVHYIANSHLILYIFIWQYMKIGRKKMPSAKWSNVALL